MSSSGAEKLRNAIKAISGDKGANIEYATVIAPPPALRIQIDGMKIELEEDDVIIPQSLTKHTRRVSVRSIDPVSVAFSDYTRTTQKSASSAETMDSTYRDSFVFSGFETGEFEITYHDELKAGDRILVASWSSSSSNLCCAVLDRIASRER